MSFDPCALVVLGPHWSTDMTSISGYVPLFLALSVVRFVGGVLKADAAGPSPRPCLPWHAAQYAVYISSPDAIDVWVIGTRVTVGGVCCCAIVITLADSTSVAIITRVRQPAFLIRSS